MASANQQLHPRHGQAGRVSLPSRADSLLAYTNQLMALLDPDAGEERRAEAREPRR
jgi:hypothetical protein